jgi:hypothetical protein
LPQQLNLSHHSSLATGRVAQPLRRHWSHSMLNV